MGEPFNFSNILPVRIDQGLNGTCWAVVVSNMLRAALNIKNGRTDNQLFSINWIVDCLYSEAIPDASNDDKENMPNGSFGGSVYHALNTIMKYKNNINIPLEGTDAYAKYSFFNYIALRSTKNERCLAYDNGTGKVAENKGTIAGLKLYRLNIESNEELYDHLKKFGPLGVSIALNGILAPKYTYQIAFGEYTQTGGVVSQNACKAEDNGEYEYRHVALLYGFDQVNVKHETSLFSCCSSRRNNEVKDPIPVWMIRNTLSDSTDTDNSRAELRFNANEENVCGIFGNIVLLYPEN